MWMAVFHLVGNGGDDIIEAEEAIFLGHSRMKDNLQEKVAEFCFQIKHVVAIDRIGNLVRFLDGIRSDRCKILVTVPFATCLGVAQPCHDLQEASDTRAHRQIPTDKYDNRYYVKYDASCDQTDHYCCHSENCSPNQRHDDTFAHRYAMRGKGGQRKD